MRGFERDPSPARSVLKDVEVSPKTRRGYGQIWECYVKPYFSPTMKLRKIHRGHIKDLLAKHRDESQLSRNTLRLIRALISVMMADAIEEGIRDTNPAAVQRRPGRRKNIATISETERQQSIRPMTVDQLSTFLKAAEQFGPRQASVLFLTLADAGLRPGEALALKWEDVDTTGRTVRITRALSEGKVKATKTEKPAASISPSDWGMHWRLGRVIPRPKPSPATRHHRNTSLPIAADS
jgi:integrase